MTHIYGVICLCTLHYCQSLVSIFGWWLSSDNGTFKAPKMMFTFSFLMENFLIGNNIMRKLALFYCYHYHQFFFSACLRRKELCRGERGFVGGFPSRMGREGGGTIVRWGAGANKSISLVHHSKNIFALNLTLLFKRIEVDR